MWVSIVFALRCLINAVGVIHVTGYLESEGFSESVSCLYESQYQNSLKYICIGNRPSTCLQQALITSDTKQNGRFRLDDEKMSRKFTVTINSLTKNDLGSYLCGVQRNSDLDVFSAVELEVKGESISMKIFQQWNFSVICHANLGFIISFSLFYYLYSLSCYCNIIIFLVKSIKGTLKALLM
uniref:Immunoglobulin V-set domain-containing protein n=1 Tax=Neolamprologus brichardi TaxID=32507 RepID=A0A3Q4IGQ2_NEOBR